MRFYLCKPSEKTQPKPFSAPAATNPAEWNPPGACVAFFDSMDAKLACLAMPCVDTARRALWICGVESLRLTRSKQNLEEPKNPSASRIGRDGRVQLG